MTTTGSGATVGAAKTFAPLRVVQGPPRDPDDWMLLYPDEVVRRFGPRALFGVGSRLAREAGCPKRLLDELLVPSEEDRRVLAGFETRGASALVCGPPGVGKTALAVMAVRGFLERGGRVWASIDDRYSGIHYQPPSVLFATAAALYEAVFRHDDALFDRATRAALLVVDDWGAQYEHEWPMARLDRLVDDRYADLRRTIVTTNLHPTDHAYSFQALYPRAYSRLLATGPGLSVMTGPDRRLEGRT